MKLNLNRNHVSERHPLLLSSDKYFHFKNAYFLRAKLLYRVCLRQKDILRKFCLYIEVHHDSL